MKTSFLLPGAALAIGLGVGFGIGKSGDEAKSEATALEEQMRTRGSDRGGLDSSRGSKNDKKARSIEEIYRQPGQSNRIQSLLDFYANLSPDEFSAEADKLEALPFNVRILAGVLLFGKWAEVDPTAAMARDAPELPETTSPAARIRELEGQVADLEARVPKGRKPPKEKVEAQIGVEVAKSLAGALGVALV